MSFHFYFGNLFFVLAQTHLLCGCQLKHVMHTHLSNTDVSTYGCEPSLEGTNQVQNASQPTTDQLEIVCVVNVKKIVGGSQLTKMFTLSRNLVNIYHI